MTGNQASPAQAGLPAPQAATAHPHDAAGHHAIGRRPADLPLAAVQKKTARYAPLLLGGAEAAVLAMAAPAMASTTAGRDTASAVSISAKILMRVWKIILMPSSMRGIHLKVQFLSGMGTMVVAEGLVVRPSTK